MKFVEVEINGKKVSGYAENIRGTLWLHFNGRVYTYESQSKRAGRKSGKGSGTKNANEILAPMPGKVIKIQVNEGEKVTEGQVLVVLEAMKMEYTLKAHGNGTVKSVLCKAGDQVGLGQRLVHMEPES